MAYHRSHHGASGLNSRFHRRRSPLKRALRHARAEVGINEGHNAGQALIIGPGGAMNLEPMAAVSPTPNETQTDLSESVSQSFVTGKTHDDDYHTTAYRDTNGQLPLMQTQAHESAEISPSPAPQVASENVRVAPMALNTPGPTARPMSTQGATPHPSPSILPLLVAPIAASLPPLLSNHAPVRSTPTTTITGTPSATSADATSTASDSADAAPPLSQNPPIIVGILMVVLLTIAALVALVSWLTRSSRRRRKYKMENRNIEAEGVGDLSTDTRSPSFEEKFDEDVNQPSANHMEHEAPFYVEPHSNIFTNKTYPVDSDLYDSMRTPDGAYFPSLATAKVPPYQSRHRDPGLGNSTATQVDTRTPSRPRGSRRSSWQDAPDFLKLDESDPSTPQLLGNNDTYPAVNRAPPNDQDLQARELGPQQFPPPGVSWASALRSNLVSALDVVKHATADKTVFGSSTPNPPEQSVHTEDKFTPLALRPGRKSLGVLPRRNTQEDDDLTFGGVRTSRALRNSSTSSRQARSSRGKREEIDGKNAVILGGLGRFSFESRMKTQSMNARLKQQKAGMLSVHSTALSRRLSGMASGSGSSANSATSLESNGDATMRKRRLGQG